MFVFISWNKQVKILVFISWLVPFGVCIQMKYFCDKYPNNKYLLELIKRRSKVQEKNIKEYCLECGLNCDQWRKFSENYMPMRVWLWLVYKFTENYCRLRLFSEFIQTQKRYPTFFDKIRILTWKLLAIYR